MAILAECDICGNQHRVKDGLAGSSIRCKECGAQISVSKDQVITPQTFIDEGGRLRRREMKQTDSLGTWFVSGLVAILVMAALIAALWLLTTVIWPTSKKMAVQFSRLSSIVVKWEHKNFHGPEEALPA